MKNKKEVVTMVNVFCLNCGSPTKKTPCQLSKEYRVFCSRTCNFDFKKKIKVGDGNSI